jgi:CIC family chloride channel protein
MTSVFMIFEMARDYAVIVPLMIANLTRFFISSRFQKQPVCAPLAHQDVIHLPSGAP